MDLAAVVLFVLIVGLAIFPGWRVNDRVGDPLGPIRRP